MSFRSVTDLFWPSLAPLPDGYHQELKDDLETRLAQFARRTAGDLRKAKRWADDEADEFAQEQDRNRRARDAVAQYDVRALARLLGVGAAAPGILAAGRTLTAPDLQREWPAAALWVVLFSVAAIAANATCASLAANKASWPRPYPSSPTLPLRDGALHYQQLARERARTTAAWRLHTDTIISYRMVAQQCFKNITKYIVALCLVLVGVLVADYVDRPGSNQRARTQSPRSSDIGDVRSGVGSLDRSPDATSRVETAHTRGLDAVVGRPSSIREEVVTARSVTRTRRR